MESVGNYFASTYRLSGADIYRIDRVSSMRLLAYALANAIGSEIRDTIAHKFHPQGITVVAIIAESHISIHTFPEKNLLTVDIFCCNPNRDLSIVDKVICSSFIVEEYESRLIDR